MCCVQCRVRLSQGVWRGIGDVCCVQCRVRLNQGVWRGIRDVFASSQTHHVSLYIPPSTKYFNIRVNITLVRYR